jgi:hypothetical protein
LYKRRCLQACRNEPTHDFLFSLISGLVAS